MTTGRINQVPTVVCVEGSRHTHTQLHTRVRVCVCVRVPPCVCAHGTHACRVYNARASHAHTKAFVRVFDHRDVCSLSLPLYITI